MSTIIYYAFNSCLRNVNGGYSCISSIFSGMPPDSPKATGLCVGQHQARHAGAEALSGAANGLMTVTEKVHSLTLLQLPRYHFNPWQVPHGGDGFDEHVFLVLAECL